MHHGKIFSCMALLVLLSGCSWNTYTKADGSTGLRANHSANQTVYYEDGTYSSNMNYNQYRPIRHTITTQNQTTVSK